ncbi:delta-like protein C isoform X2 [Xenia sp. Carnegie-2017]|uniref:delta-like protein C isoform X2 n=1 Tax=Xenia sp. Carnegie-2017 TaxID=2897299 RepID=UPI001F04601F|nr:delta-like protein C isoform X2 [Xenia sp. Carnegie-2017]
MFFQVLTNFLWASLLACLLIGELVNGDDKAEVKLEVLLSKVSNRSTLRECCDKNGGSSCTNICDIYFVVCIPKPALCQNSSVFLRTSSKFSSPLKNSTSSNKNSSGNFLSMLFNVNVKDLTSFTITIYPRDSSIIDSSTPVRVASHTETFLRPRPTSPIQRTYSKNNITFVFIYRLNVTCAKHYYGENCVYCLGRNDRFGHSRCLQNGTKVCIYGWKGRSCTEPYCPDGCVNGNCKQPFECSCKSGWRGPKCTECIPNTKCRHGYCDRPFDCLCKASWTGQYCDVVMNYCIRFNPCRNGRCHNSYRTNYTCSCFNGWKGQLCDEPACSSSCNLSNADCTNDRCNCRQGWTGPDCNKCLPSPGCKYGVCLTPFQCLCNHGWQGENCSQPVSYCKQQSQNPCQNNGTCVDISSNEHRCDCKEGFSGFHCDIVECSSSCRGKCEGNVCRCRSGWKGKNCSECVKRSSCIHGYCKKPNECICHKNWTGLFCNVSNVEHGSSHIRMTTSTLQDRPA